MPIEENPNTPPAGDPTAAGEDEQPPASAADEDEGQGEGAEQLGDAGKKALDAMKEKWHGERDKRRELERKLAERETPPAGEDEHPDPEQIRREAARDATQKANTRILRAEVRSAAAGKLSDPADALLFLDLDAFEVDEDGSVDGDEIREAVDDLLANRPYLAAKATRFQGTGDGGAQRKASGPSQLTRDDLQRMSAQQITQAKREGRLRDLLSGKN